MEEAMQEKEERKSMKNIGGEREGEMKLRIHWFHLHTMERIREKDNYYIEGPEADRQTDRQTDIHTYIHTDRQTDRQRGSHKDRWTNVRMNGIRLKENGM